MSIGRAGKWPLLLAIAAAIAAFFAFDLGAYLTLDSLKARQAELAEAVAARPFAAAALFFALYVAVTAASLPGAAIMTLAAGAIFGLVEGTLLVSFASSIGASLAFLSSRLVLRDWVKARFGRRLDAIDRGVAKDGAFYLLSLRLIPLFPFFLVNLAMGLTGMRLAVFYAVSQIGMLPATVVFVNAGTQLARIENTGDILSPGLIGSFVLLGLFPLIARFVVGALRRRRVYRGHLRPRRFDRNMVVIGAGAGGLVSAYIAATVRAKVTLVEAGKMGGDCLNYGCVPSKALIRSARAAHELRHADRLGVRAAPPEVDFGAVMARVREVIASIAPADSVERYTGLGVDVRLGHATIIDPWTVEIAAHDGSTERLTTRSIVIAAGAEPFVPDLPGLREVGVLTSDTMWDALARREEVPPRLAIIGGGPIGVELAQAFARLGSAVTLVQSGPRLLPNDEPEASELVAQTLRAEGVSILLDHRAVRCEGKTLIAIGDAGERAVPFDELIVAIGRKARLTGYGLEALGIETDGTIVVDEALRTVFPNIYAVGDVAGPYQFTHFAAHQAWYASVNALFGSFRTFRADYTVIPWTTFADPEVAHVGHTRESATKAGVAFEVVRYDLDHLDRAVTDEARAGFVLVLVAPGKDTILGATIVAAHAGEMLAEFITAMKHGLGLNKILGTIHAYPTLSEANKYAAGEWRKAHQPERLLKVAARYHAWRRG